MYIEKLSTKDIKKICSILGEDYYGHKILYAPLTTDNASFMNINYGEKQFHRNILAIKFNKEGTSYVYLTDFGCCYTYRLRNKETTDKFVQYLLDKFDDYSMFLAKQSAMANKKFCAYYKQIISLCYDYNNETKEFTKKPFINDQIVNSMIREMCFILYEGANPNGKFDNSHTYLEIAEKTNNIFLINQLEINGAGEPYEKLSEEILK